MDKVINRILMRMVALLLAVLICVQPSTGLIVRAKAIAIVDDIAIGVVLSLLAVTGVVFATEPDARAGAVQAYQQGTAAFRSLVDDVGSKVITGATSIAMAPAALLSVLKSAKQTYPVDKTIVPNAALLGTMPMDGSVLLSGAYPVLGTSSDTTVLVFSHPVKGFVFLSVNFANCLSSSGELWVQSTNNALIVSSEFKANGMPHVTKFAVKSLSPSTPLRVSFAGYDSNKQVYGILDFSVSQFFEFVGPIDAVKFVGVTTGKFADYWGKDWTGANAPSVDAYPTIGYTVDKNICADGLMDHAVAAYIAAHPTVGAIDIALHPDPGDYVGVDWRDVLLSPEFRDILEDTIRDGGFGGGGADRPIPDPDDPGGSGDASSPPPWEDSGNLELPDQGDVSLPDKIVGLFPFCIPWDINRGFELLCADPVAPRWEIPFKIDGLIDDSIVLDFEPFDNVVQIFRFFEGFIFTVALAILTRRMIKW